MQITRLDVVLAADLADLGALMATLDHFAGVSGLSPDVAFKVQLCLDELVNNVIDHGYAPGAPGEIRLRIEHHGDRLAIEISDDAALFDPFSNPPPDLDLGVDDRPLGGLGVHLVRTLMTEARYAVDAGRNHVRLVLSLEPAS
ncbi:ATP-binding protein [Chthonobacter albigriseus]|uniref:ATP-binding protein n=1 Tax=Chthonobacter albigriseus TaxID=1683161 RepID=UPI0015EFA307|nr:ATP-binding protein [Chthonobacter albigriseus]